MTNGSMFLSLRIDQEVQEECFRARQYVGFEILMEKHPAGMLSDWGVVLRLKFVDR